MSVGKVKTYLATVGCTAAVHEFPVSSATVGLATEASRNSAVCLPPPDALFRFSAARGWVDVCKEV